MGTAVSIFHLRISSLELSHFSFGPPSAALEHIYLVDHAFQIPHLVGVCRFFYKDQRRGTTAPG